jgi:hypothetical protein
MVRDKRARLLPKKTCVRCEFCALAIEQVGINNLPNPHSKSGDIVWQRQHCLVASE